MANDDKHEQRKRFELSERIEAQLRELCGEDDFAGTLNELDEYPKLETRDLSTFERDLRDWGMVYGLAFGLAISLDPEIPHSDAAAAAFRPAYRTYNGWSGELEDPGLKRENAIRTILRRFEEVDQKRYAERKPHAEMTPELCGAIQDLAEWARG